VIIIVILLIVAGQLQFLPSHETLPTQEKQFTEPTANSESSITAESTEDELKQEVMNTLARLLKENNGDRILLTHQNQEVFEEVFSGPIPGPGADCLVEFDDSPPNSQVTYTNNKYKFNLQLPFNNAWGNETFRLKAIEGPYRDEQVNFGPYFNAVLFGPMDIFFGGGCGWQRRYTLEISDPQPFNTLLRSIAEDLQDTYGIPLREDVKPATKTINRFKTISYIEPGICGTPTMIIFGEDFSMELRTGCEGTPTETFDIFEAVAQSIKQTN